MNVYYAMAQDELDRFYAFREMESRVRADLSPQLIAEVRAAVQEERDAEGERPRYELKDGAANISINGTLTEKRHLSDDLYGDVTTYADIRRATAAADADPLAREIIYHVNSPGGTWDGVDYTAEAINNLALKGEVCCFGKVYVSGSIPCIAP